MIKVYDGVSFVYNRLWKLLIDKNMHKIDLRVTEKAIMQEVNLQDKDELWAEIREAFIDENACLRYRITERFNTVVQGLFEQHKHQVDGEAENSLRRL